MCPERREELIHQSDFTSASIDWREGKSEITKHFRQNGYFHIAVEANYSQVKCILIDINDFKVRVDAEFVDKSSANAIYGIVFRNMGNEAFYALGVNWEGYYSLLFHGDKKWDRITPWRTSEFVKRATVTNSFMVEMVGQKMTVAANGHALTSATDSRLSRGAVGLMVLGEKGYSEARFRNFRLYSIEKEEEAIIMPGPMMAPPVRPTAFEDEGVEFVIEKVTVPSSAKTPPPEGKPRVTQPASSAQRPPDVRTYLEGIIEDAGMTAPTREMQEETIKELTGKLNAFIIGEIFDHMPKQYLEAFTKLYEQNRPQAEINRFIEEHMPNARQVFAEIFEKFRRVYGGKSSRSADL